MPTEKWRRFVLPAALLLTTAVQWPALRATLFDDDYRQAGYLAGLPTMPARSLFDLYRFEDVAFFRPLSSVLMAADWHLFHRALWAYHLHSLLWLLAVVAFADRIFRRLIPSASALATLVFALGMGAGDSVLWWCARHVLVSAACGLFALWAQLRWRQDGWRPGGPLAVVGLLAALAGGESGVQALCFAMALEALYGPPSRRRRLESLAGLALLLLAYLGLHMALGYTVKGNSWHYIDPLHEPRRYVVEALRRLPPLLALLLGHGIAQWPLTDASQLAAAVSALSSAAALVLCVAPCGIGEPDRRGVRALLLGAVPALTISLACPDPRVRLLPALAAAACVASWLHLLANLVRHGTSHLRRLLPALALVTLALLACVSAPLATHLYVRRQSDYQRSLHAAMVGVDLGPSPRRVVVLTGPLQLYPLQIARKLFRDGPTVPSTLLYDGEEPLVVVRAADNELALGLGGEKVLRDGPWKKLALGQGKRLSPGIAVTVVDANTAGTTLVDVTFDRSLDDPSVVLLAWSSDTLRRIDPPAIEDAEVLDAITYR